MKSYLSLIKLLLLWELTECESLITALNGIHHSERSIRYERTHNNIQSKFLIWYAGGEDIEHHSLIRTSRCTKLSLYRYSRKQGDHKSSLVTFPFCANKSLSTIIANGAKSMNLLERSSVSLPSARTVFFVSALSDAKKTSSLRERLSGILCKFCLVDLPQAALECFLEDKHECSRKVKRRHRKSLTILLFAFILCLYQWDQKWQGQELAVFESHSELFSHFWGGGGIELQMSV